MNNVSAVAKRRLRQTNRASKLGTSWLVRAGKQQTRAHVFGILFGAVLAYAGYYLLVAPARLSNGAAATELARLSRQDALARTIEQSRSKFEAERRRDVAAYAEARRLLPDSLEVTNVLNEVQQAATREHVILTGFDAIAKTDVMSPEHLYERETPATVVGPYPQVVSFLRAVARLPRIVQVRELALTSLGRKVAVNFTLMIYYAPAPVDLPPLPPELQPLLAQQQDRRDEVAGSAVQEGKRQ